MFAQSSNQIREAIYGVLGQSQISSRQVNVSNGTAFMIAPGVLATAAHLTHVKGDPSRPTHTSFEVIRAPDIGQTMERAHLIAEDSVRDVALLRIENPRSNVSLILEPNPAIIGTTCGSLGFPLASVAFGPTGRAFNLVVRFQGANISAFHTQTDPSGRQLDYYETDALMYKGSSGCPGFLVNAHVFGVHVKSVLEARRRERATDVQAQGETRLAISLWVPSMDVTAFAVANGIVF